MIDHGEGSKEWILGRQDLRAYPVECPEWGGRVFVRPLTSEEKDEFEEWLANMDGTAGTSARLAAMGLCNEDASSQDWAPDEIETLGGKHGAVVERIARKVKEVTYVLKEDVEEAEKNSESGTD